MATAKALKVADIIIAELDGLLDNREYIAKIIDEETAAPNLLAALKRIADWRGIDGENGSAGAQQQIREIARTAIAKANPSAAPDEA